MVTFDNETEVVKCAGISKSIQLVLRIVTDDRGSQCRLSSKFGAPRTKWRSLLKAAQREGLQVVGVSFHVGSGCRDASRYEAALKDAKEIFDMATEYGHKMTLLDIGGGFPGETHSMWNPADHIDETDEDAKIGSSANGSDDEESDDDRFMFFTEIAERIAPFIDKLFPPTVRVIAEPGRYFVAACATLCCTIIAVRSNAVDNTFVPEPICDDEAAELLDKMTREDETKMIRRRGRSISVSEADDPILATIQEELADYSKLFASQQLVQQEVDTYNDALDLYKEDYQTATDLLGPPDEEQMERKVLSAEGLSYSLANMSMDDGEEEPSGLITLAAAGEAAVNGILIQAVADAAPLQDDYAVYINDGVYGAFNNIMFDHATVRPRILGSSRQVVDATVEEESGLLQLETGSHSSDEGDEGKVLYASTVFGPTCDSIDVIARSVLLPKMKIGDWMYFQNMGAYTMAASSSFNGFTPSTRFYVCSVQPEYFEDLVKGPDEKATTESEEKKEE
jgi:diaminopimelate decarboxylase